MASLNVDPVNFDFDVVTVGSSAQQQVSFSADGNPGDVVNVTSILVPDGFSCNVSSFSVTVGGAPVTGEMTFSPTAVQSYGGTGSVHNNSVEDPVVDLSFNGTGANAVSSSPASEVFPGTKSGSTSPQVVFTITNDNVSGNIVFTGITVPTEFGQGGTWPTFPFTLAPGGTKQFGVVFAPTSLGNFADNVVITMSPMANLLVPVSGTSISVPQIPRGFSPFIASASGLITGENVGAAATPVSFFQISSVSAVIGLTGQAGAFGFATAVGPMFFDFGDLNSSSDSSSIMFRTEVEPELRFNTYRGVILTYRDLGPAQVTVSISGASSATSAVVSLGSEAGAELVARVGMIQALLSAQLVQVFVPLQITDTMLVVSLFRSPGGGNVVINRVRLIAELSQTEVL